MARSKSTPGLLESSGKIPLESMVVSRLDMLPLLNRSRVPSRCPSHSSGSVGSHCEDHHSHSTSDNNHSHHSEPLEDNSAMQPTPSGDLTTSMTVSSITSYVADALQKGTGTITPPGVTIHGPTDTETSPCYQNAAIGQPHSPSHPLASSQQQSITAQLSPFATTQTAAIPGLSYISQGMSNGASAPNIPSQTYLMGQTPHNPSQLSAGSAGSLHHDPSHDILLAEITRLRERLVTLETENASMSVKLNQQQWEVEHRLAEIEMHICGSDSVGSGESNTNTSLSIGNKESII